MKIIVELDEEEEVMLREAFESAIAECYFTEIDEEIKTDYYSSVQQLIKKLSLNLNVDDVIDELIELNSKINDVEDIDDIIDIDDDE